MSLKTSVTWNGLVWTLSKAGYMVRRSTYLHRAKWELHRGPIPAGHHIHHKNHDRADNRLANLECLSPAEHAKEHSDRVASLMTPAARAANKAARQTSEHKKQLRKSLAAYWENCKVTAEKSRCQACGNWFQKISPLKKYCDSTCSHNSAQSKRGRQARANDGRYDEQRTCRICQSLFVVNKHKKTQCCSSSCANTYGHQLRKEKTDVF